MISPILFTPEQLDALRSTPEATEKVLNLIEAGERLYTYVQALWHIIEPAIPFVGGRTIEEMCEHLEAVTRGEIQKIVFNVPPGFSKSLLTNVFWPSWEWGPCNRPSERYVTASYSQKLTIRDNRRCRALIAHEDYQIAWGDRFQLSNEQNTKERFDNDKTGWKFASASCSLTGERGTRMVIDDPHSVDGAESEAERGSTTDWFAHTVPTRVSNQEKDPFILIMQRVHMEDCAAMAIKLGWEHFVVPMRWTKKLRFKSRTSLNHRDLRTTEGELAWPERFTPKAVEDLEKTLRSKGGEYAVAGQLQQDPIPAGGGMFQEAWLKVPKFNIPVNAPRVRRWDLAATEKQGADWTVGLLLAHVHGYGFVIEHVIRFRGNPGEVKRKIVEVARVDGHGVRVGIPHEPAAAGKFAVAEIVEALVGFQVEVIDEKALGNKQVRAIAAAVQAEHGKLWVADLEGGGQTASRQEVIEEVTSFPFGSFDDIVDALSGAVYMMSTEPEPLVGTAPSNVPQVSQEEADDEEPS